MKNQIGMLTKFLFFIIILYCTKGKSQDLSNCSGQLVTLQTNPNSMFANYSGSINLQPNCGCNSVGKCQKVRVQIPSNYTCQGLVVSLQNSQEWYNDHFDLFTLPSCSYLGADNNPFSQKSNYIIPIDPIQTGGIFEFLLCAGDDLPSSATNVAIDINTSDLCTVDALQDCDNGCICFDQNSDQISGISPITGNSDFTVEYQFKLNVATNNGLTKMFKWLDNSNLETFVVVNNNNSLFLADKSFNNSLAYINPFPSINIRDGMWHHFAVTKSGNIMKVYLDNLTYTYNTEITSSFDIPNRFKLGRTSEVVSKSLNGCIDEFRIWDYERTNSQISSFKNTALQPPISGLKLYYNFDQGIPSGDNKCLPYAIDKSQNGGTNSFLTSFSLTGNSSNIVLSDLNIPIFDEYCNSDPCSLNNSCTPECSSDSINIGTGLNYNDGSLSSINSFDGSWRMISGPDPVSYPKPVYVLNPISAWDQLPNSQYISPYPNPYNNTSSPIPYILERCFCVCKDNSNISLKTSSYVDNFLDLSLHNENGTLIKTLLDYNGAANGSSETSAFRNPAFISNLDTILKQGKFCLRAGLRNDGTTAMGVSISAILSGAGLIENGCCDSFTYITGYVYNDITCNGLIEYPEDNGLTNAIVKLFNSSNVVIATDTTDAYGYFTFSGIPPGTYTVRQDSIPGRTRLQGNNGYVVIMNQNNAIGNIDFGNCTNCCATSENLTRAVNISVNSTLLVDTINNQVTIRRPNLLSCQFISKIYWGDGTVSTLNQGDAIPFHKYEEDGTYLISIEVTSKNLGNICQVDEVHFTVLFNCVATSIVNPETNYFNIFPNPASDNLNIKLKKNNNGFTIEVLSIGGAKIISQNIAKSVLETKIDISSLKSNLYIISLKSSNGEVMMAKFVKM
jgi:hypothetical protein